MIQAESQVRKIFDKKMSIQDEKILMYTIKDTTIDCIKHKGR